MTALRALVVGGGSIGTRHLRNLHRLGVGPAAVVEPDERRRRELSADGRAAVFPTLDEGLAWGPAFAVIATPTDLHAGQALRAARAGCHLFIEKPLAHTADGLAELLREVEDRRLITLVGCNMRFHPGPAAVKRLLDEGAVGRVLAARLETGSYLPRWRPGQDYRRSYSASAEHGGAVLDCIHEIDLALWYFGPARVVGAAVLPATALGLETDGLAEILLRHASGVLSSVRLNFVQRDYRRGCQVIGTEGTLYWDFGEGRVDVFGPDGQQRDTLRQPADWDTNRMYVDELAHFVDAVRHGRPTTNPVAGGAAALEVALAVKQESGVGCS